MRSQAGGSGGGGHVDLSSADRSEHRTDDRLGCETSRSLVAQAAGLVLLTLLMHHGSPIELSPKVFDDSSGLRTRIYWGQLIVIAVTTPLSYLVNKVWTFGHTRERVLTDSDSL